MRQTALSTFDRESVGLPDIHWQLRSFFEFNRFTATDVRHIAQLSVPIYENEFWTSKQRDCHSIHEVSYRACYKPQLPDFFIRRFCEPGDVVYDPFMGRGTTLIQAKLLGCPAIGNDINPVASILAASRLNPPRRSEVEKRAKAIALPQAKEFREDLLVFFHPDTLREICGWRQYFRDRKQEGTFDRVDAWIQMVCCNRLTGHSTGFFSVYTLPPNQATSVEAQKRINEKRKQMPEYRDTKALILRKSRQLLADRLPAYYRTTCAELICASADATPSISAESVKLIVTSPPFLDTVNYVEDNWLRMWFCDSQIPAASVWQFRRLERWLSKMTQCFQEFRRVLRNDGVIAFEVGEIRKGVLRLENEVIKAALSADLIPECVMINSQAFTKTANCWGISNNELGTNSNRIVLLKKR